MCVRAPVCVLRHRWRCVHRRHADRCACVSEDGGVCTGAATLTGVCVCVCIDTDGGVHIPGDTGRCVCGCRCRCVYRRWETR